MDASGKVAHKGRIVSVSNGEVLVNIISESACATCHAKGMCSMSETKEKTITVPERGLRFRAGEEVSVALRSSLGLRAVWWAYLFPLLLFLVILLSLLNIPVSEGLSALLALLSIALYYLLLWQFRNRLKKKFEFEIEKLS